MSIEAKPSSNPYDNSQDQSENTQVAEPTETLTTDQLRTKVRPDHKPTLVERYKDRKSQFIAGVALTALVIGGGYGASKIAEGISENKEEQDPNVTGPITPGQPETAAPQPSQEVTPNISPSDLPTSLTTPSASETIAAQPASLEIKVGQTPEALAKNLFEDVFPQWTMAGANEEFVEETTDYIIKNGDTQLANHFGEIAKKNSEQYSKAIFGANPNERQLEITDDFENINTWALNMHYLTSDSEEPYKLWNTVETVDVASQTDTSRTLRIEYTEHDNSKSGLNDAAEIIAQGGEGTIDGNKRVALVTFDSTSGSEIVTSYTVVPQNQ